MGQAIMETENRLHSKPLRKRPRQVLFVTITDGLENSSREFTEDRVFDLVNRQRTHFDWQFVYLGANQDAIAEGAKYGVTAGCCMAYDGSKLGAAQMWQTMGSAVARRRMRVRRRLCVTCGYPAGPAPVCSECARLPA